MKMAQGDVASREAAERLKEVLSNMSREEFLRLVYQVLDDEASKQQAHLDMIDVAEKLLHITARYFEFRIREYTARGVIFSYDFNYEKRWDGVSLTINVRFPKDQLMDLARWHEFIRMSRMSDAQIKKVILRRLDFAAEAGEEAWGVREGPKDKLVEEARELMEGEAQVGGQEA